MFLLPFGLQSRIVKWPIASLLIIVITCVVSIMHFSQNALYIRFFREALVDQHVLITRVNLLKDSCSVEFEAKTCTYISVHLQEKDLWDLGPFLRDYNKEFPDAAFLDVRKLSKWLSNEDIHKTIHDENIKKSLSYQAYVQSLAQFRQHLVQRAKEDQTLMRGNANIIANVKALFLHEGWVHLIGNMIIFALFAFFLEQRVGPFGVLAIYFLGGVLSNFLQVPFLPMGMRLLGASGAVSAIVGAFAVFFWREKMRCFLSLAFVYNRMILMPSWLYIGAFVVVSDVVGVIGGSGPTAHLAHLGGLGVGAVIAMMQMDLFPLKKTFLFRYEQTLYYEAKEAKVLEEKMALYRRIYSLNRESFYSFRALFVYFFKQSFQATSFKDEDKEFVTTLLNSCLIYTSKGPKYDMAHEILSMVPLSWHLQDFKLQVTPENVIECAEYFQRAGDLVQTLRFYGLFFDMFAAHPMAQEVQTVVMRIFDQIEKLDLEVKAQLLEALLVYSDHHPDNHFQNQIRHLIHQVHREEKNAAS